MGAYSDNLQSEVRLERMTPEQVAREKSQHPCIYVPFCSIEWHGYHNAVGLDALKAHEQLVGLAVQTGGIVYPAIFFGVGGGHVQWPSSFMVGKEPMTQIVIDLLRGFERDGYRKAILLAGHYPNREEFLDVAISAYRKTGGKMQVLALVENQAPDVGGDHAAKFETSYMLYLHPATVDMDRLKSGKNNDLGDPDECRNWMDSQYKEHPLYGLVGIDPRAHASAAVGRLNTQRLIRFLAQWLGQVTPDGEGAE